MAQMQKRGFETLVVLATLVLPPGPAGATDSVLSAQQQAAVAKATRKMSATEKQMVAEWSDGKKLAEFFCARAGLAALKQQEPSADRVFLGPDEAGEKNFVLTGNTHLSGRGSVRVQGGWKAFDFECQLDPAKAAVSKFSATLSR